MLYNRRQFQSVLTSKGQKQGQNRRRNLIIKVVAINKSKPPVERVVCSGPIRA